MGVHELYGGLRQSDVEGLVAALAGKAADASVVHRAGAETVDGAKTFTVAPQVPVGHLLAHPVRRDDARLADARAPTAHADTHAVGGVDPVAAADIGAAETVHTHTAADVTDGVFALARLPVGAGGQQVARGNDARFVPGGGAAGQVLTKASSTDHVLAWTDPVGSGAGGTYIAGAVPPGAATVTITHNLGTRDVVVMVRETAGYQYVPVANDAPTINTVRLVFAAAPASGQYRYVVFAALGEPVQGPVAPTSHAPTHAAGGADPLSPGAIGAAEAGHTHSASEVSSGTLNLSRLPTGTSGSTVALGNHTHSQYAATGHTHSGYAATGHTHDADDLASGTVALARLPTGTGSSTVALGNHTHTPASVGAAPAAHTHPQVLGPYGVVDFAATALGPADPRTLATVTVPDPGFDWRPLCFAECDISSDINGTRPALQVRLGSATGALYARGSGQLGANNWTMAQAVPRFDGPALSAGPDRTFYLVLTRDYGGGWIQSSGDFDPHLTIYVIPA